MSELMSRVSGVSWRLWALWVALFVVALANVITSPWVTPFTLAAWAGGIVTAELWRRRRK